MDESWRIPIGSMVPRRRSTEEQARRRRPLGPGPGPDGLDPDDFCDVFGGPPRTVLLRRFSGELSGDSRTATFYDEIFRPGAERGHPAAARGGGGRSLPGFSIPPGARGGLVRTEEGFYDDIFGSGDRGWDVKLRSRSRSNTKSMSLSKTKSNSSSVLSSEGLSPLRPPIADDAMLSSFTSKLRPITIPSRRPDSSPPSTISGGEQSTHRTLNIPCPPRSCFMDFHDSNNNCSSSSGSTLLLRQRSHAEFPRCFSPPEAVKKPDVSDADSPSSVNSSALLIKARQCERWEREREMEKVVMEVEEGGEVDSSFVIEIDSHCMGESEGSAAVDEAIAWAKEKYWNPVSRDEMQESNAGGNQKGSKEAFDEHSTEEKL